MLRCRTALRPRGRCACLIVLLLPGIFPICRIELFRLPRGQFLWAGGYSCWHIHFSRIAPLGSPQGRLSLIRLVSYNLRPNSYLSARLSNGTRSRGRDCAFRCAGGISIPFLDGAIVEYPGPSAKFPAVHCQDDEANQQKNPSFVDCPSAGAPDTPGHLISVASHGRRTEEPRRSTSRRVGVAMRTGRAQARRGTTTISWLGPGRPACDGYRTSDLLY